MSSCNAGRFRSSRLAAQIAAFGPAPFVLACASVACTGQPPVIAVPGKSCGRSCFSSRVGCHLQAIPPRSNVPCTRLHPACPAADADRKRREKRERQEARMAKFRR